ncbi:PEPxxWA-CTERM sorting domain-containing protein [Phenylobacterium sp.]|uniref:PEPxxWA-CTERM sorting domain-containing protein n=1 Tax=Phenylobacterium sp. TaxID=1871053 RepID=UPI002733ED59|nr:PEPxxWA-CTERM sorting domain-containing protein [Phenylobacterium sp.]MDP3593077.1 PEPxxWA-CTERM sorting domain-containing protein [Phenylobacterium sp.]
MHKIIGAAIAGAALLGAAGAANAATVALENGNFNAGWSQADGDFRPGHAGGNPDGWGASGGSGTGHWNPTVADFANEAAHGGVGWAHGAGISSVANGAMLAQKVAGHTIQANTRYTLTLDVGSQMRASGPFGFEIGLLGGGLLDGTGAIFAELTNATSGITIAPGTFGTVSLVFETGANDAFLGQELFILLSGTNGGAAFDNAMLDASPLSVSAVPEPATWAMMIVGFGGVGSMVRSARRRGAVGLA